MLMYFHTEIRKDCSGVEQCVTYGNPSSISPASSSLYKKAMNEHHPDKLASKGLPEQALERAKAKTQDIQAAYELIKKERR